MTKTEQKRITQFLYSIQTTEFAVENIEKEIELLDQKIQTPPKITSGGGEGLRGGESVSKQEQWTLFLDQYWDRREYLTTMLIQRQLKISDYYGTLEKMAEAMDWGSLASQICREKYYRHRTSDVAICKKLYCAERTFYRCHTLLLRFFLDVLPNRFADR